MLSNLSGIISPVLLAVASVVGGPAGRQECLFWSPDGGATPAETVAAYRKLRTQGIPAELHAVDDELTPEARRCWQSMYERQMNFDGQLSAKVPQRARFPNDDARLSYEKQPVWPEGRMPNPDVDQCEPYLEWHLPKHRLSCAVMIVFSGGAYANNSTDGNSVPPIRRYLNGKGMSVVTLKYRTPRPKKLPKHASAWADLQRTVRLVRRGAAARGLDPQRIGLCGGSAGGHLALLGALSSTRPAYAPVDDVDREPCEVQLAVALFPAYVLSDGFDGENRGGGNDPNLHIAEEFAFDAKSCPVLFLHGDADGYSAMGSVRTWERLQAMGVKSDLHVFALQPHDFQYAASPGTGAYAYLDVIWAFLAKRGFAK